MRYGVVADVHGNLHALRAAIDVLAAERVDRHLCLGDLVGFGPHPNECVRRIAELGAITVAGNHDLIAVGRRGADGISPAARASLEWTRARLDAPTRRYLEGLSTVAEPEPGLVMTHGGLGDPGRYVASRSDAADELRRLRAEHPDAWVLLLGHTHRPLAVAEHAGALAHRGRRTIRLPVGDRVLLNPGGLGQARQRLPHGWALVLDPAARVARFHVVRYDVDACRRALAEHGLPADSHHRNPYAPRALARRVARGLARGLAR